MKNIKFSVIGVGAIAESAHIPGLLGIPQAKIQNICDIRENALQEVADKFSIERCFTDYKQAMDDDVDAVLISTDAPIHAEIVIHALEVGLPVFVEKPMTTTVLDAEKIYELSMSKNIPVMVGYQLRHMPNHIKVKEYIHKDIIGDVYLMHIRAETLVIKPDETLLIDYGTHFFDLTRFYLDGRRVESVYANYISDNEGVQLGASIFIQFEKCPFQVVLETYWVPSFNWSDVERTVTFLGKYGKILTKMSIPEITLLKTRTIRGRKVGAKTFMPKEAKNFYMSMGDFAYRKQLQIFVDCLLENKKVPVNSYDGLIALKIADAAFRSASTNLVIKDIEL